MTIPYFFTTFQKKVSFNDTVLILFLFIFLIKKYDLQGKTGKYRKGTS